MHTPHDSSLGQDVSYPSRYDAGLLFPIPRAGGRALLGIDDDATLPFIGHDRWHAYELGWLDLRGKPCVGTATFAVPCTSPNLIESKSLKLYLNSLNAERIESADAMRQRIAADLSACAGAQVEFAFGLPPMQADPSSQCVDALELDIAGHGPPEAGVLQADSSETVEETLTSHLLKSNCPVTNQPDWATLLIHYRGPRIDREGLLRYVASFRNHADFHEQCVERIYQDLMARCTPQWLSVEARYTRRGGLDINPWRASHGVAVPAPRRELRQ